MIGATELSRGTILLMDGDPWEVTDVTFQTPSARGASMLAKAKIRNLRTGQTLAKTWRGGEMLDTAEVEKRAVQYLYRQDDDFHFMDKESFDQFSLPAEALGDAVSYMIDGLELRSLSHEGRVITMELPTTVELEVVETAPVIKGATAQAQLKPATVETGLQVMVPPYLETGERIKVDTRDGRFVERAKS